MTSLQALKLAASEALTVAAAGARVFAQSTATGGTGPWRELLDDDAVLAGTHSCLHMILQGAPCCSAVLACLRSSCLICGSLLRPEPAGLLRRAPGGARR